jgi:prepilin-type N-terminal cleavage/methylation domain-containing protein
VDFNLRPGLTKGFSFIEMSFAICLIGIGLVFALKGTALIDAMKGRILAFELEQTQANVLRYREDFRELPGDGTKGEQLWDRAPSLSPITGGVLASLTGNNRIDGQLYNVDNVSGEQFNAWVDLRGAGFVEGDRKLRGGSTLPENPFGGFYGFDEGNLGQKDGSLCATKIPGQVAQSVDKRLDDGRIDKGRLVATSKFSVEENNHFDAPDTEPYNVEKEYIICVPLLP